MARERYRIADLTVDVEAVSVTRDGRDVPLPGGAGAAGARRGPRRRIGPAGLAAAVAILGLAGGMDERRLNPS
jgi:hypothetical protein